ncbi:MAG TPA: hypothetical protein VII63_04925 [Caulobacteraceae bacterium]
MKRLAGAVAGMGELSDRSGSPGIAPAMPVAPERITASRLRTAVYLAIFVVMLAALAPSLLRPESGTRLFWTWAGCAFLGVGVLVFSWMQVRPQVIGLDANGLTLAGGLVRTPLKIAWRDIEPFFVFDLPRGGSMVGFNYAPGRQPDSPLAGFASGFGADGALPGSWTPSTKDMVAKLNDYRRRALDLAPGV